jgi:hypothetical protein
MPSFTGSGVPASGLGSPAGSASVGTALAVGTALGVAVGIGTALGVAVGIAVGSFVVAGSRDGSGVTTGSAFGSAATSGAGSALGSWDDGALPPLPLGSGHDAGWFAGVAGVSPALGSPRPSLPAVDIGSAAPSWGEPSSPVPHPYNNSTEQKLLTALIAMTVALV